MLQNDLDSSSAIRDGTITDRTRAAQANHEISNANPNAPSKAPSENLPQRSGKTLANDKQQNLLTNLEHLVKQYPEYIAENMEEIHPYIKPPWWTLRQHTSPTSPKRK